MADDIRNETGLINRLYTEDGQFICDKKGRMNR